MGDFFLFMCLLCEKKVKYQNQSEKSVGKKWHRLALTTERRSELVLGHFLSRGFFWIDLFFQNFFSQMYLLVVDIFFTILYSINIWRLSSVGRANGSYPLGRRFKPHSRYIKESITDSFFLLK